MSKVLISMRKILSRAVLLVFTALIFCTNAYGDASLYQGPSYIGAVPTIENNSGPSVSEGLFVPAEDVARLLGFSVSRSGDELLLSRGNTRIKLINNSAAAWRGLSLVPLQSAPFENNGRLWIDSYSAISLFQASAGSGANNKLRFNFNQSSVSTVTASNAKVNEIDFGRFEPVIPTTASTTAANVKASPKTVAQVPANPVNTDTKTEPQSVSTKSTATTTTASSPATTLATNPTSSKKQPRFESFKLDDSRTEKSENYSGAIQSIRWTSQEGEHKKIRAVIMVNANAEPQVYMDKEELHALFSTSYENPETIASPYENIKLEARQNSKGVDLIFKPLRITKAEKVVLSNPRRIVFDFFFPSNVNIVSVNNAPQVVASKPVPPIQTTPTQTITKTITTPTPTKKPTTTTAATQTTPQNILMIPMKKGARKIVVVDPGHGGKDPGAADNGVTEKNVNLAIGLELEKVLVSRGYQVIMTRNTDVYLKLQERTDIANNANADLFVSIHVNALPSKKTMTGFEIYIMALPTDKDAMNLAKIENREYVEGKGLDTENVDKRTEMLLRILGDMQQNNKISESTDFAAALYNAGTRNGLPMRRVAQAPFFVLRGAGMPAVLLETGFVTNAAESQLLATQPYQQKIANAMAEGIINYLR